MNPSKNILVFLLSLAAVMPIAYSKNVVKCDPKHSDTPDKINACITKEKIIQHMTDFQAISDNNPDPTFAFFPGAPHGSRDPGTPGDIASKDYLAQKMREAGYNVTVQSYPVAYGADAIVPVLQQLASPIINFTAGKDFATASPSPSGDVTAFVQPVGALILDTPSSSGCAIADFQSPNPSVAGKIALMERGGCPNITKVTNAAAAGAVGAITVNYADQLIGNSLVNNDGDTFSVPGFPVFSYLPFHMAPLLTSQPIKVHMKSQTVYETRTTYNIIADSRWGDPNNVLILVAHYDSIFGAGMNDNASGSVGIMETALAMKDTQTHNKVRFIWSGGEELGVLGTQYYIGNLSDAEIAKIAFVLDADVIATTNFVAEIYDLSKHPDSGFTPEQVATSMKATKLFNQFFASANIPTNDSSREGTDISFCGTDGCWFASLLGVPFGGMVFTGQDSIGGGKTAADVNLYQNTYLRFLMENPNTKSINVVGPYETCIDTPYIFCDNLSNNINFEIMLPSTQAYAAVAIQLANDRSLRGSGLNTKKGHGKPYGNRGHGRRKMAN
jgi:hypothetical protein